MMLYVQQRSIYRLKIG